MDLRSRLARFGSPATAHPDDARLDDARPTGPPDDAALAALGFESIPSPAGLVRVRSVLLRAASPGPLAPLIPVLTAPLPADVTADRILLLDTETTGLAGGTGTLAFLVGTAWWEEGGLRVRQYLLASPSAEDALLGSLAELAARFAVVVTYNGQTFDLPLLRTRGILCRRRDLLADLAGLDLLPAARRLWGRRLPDCRQTTVETAVGCDHRGAGDIPGHLIPAAWWGFVRRGETDALREVCDHNVWDLQGMAAILDAATARSRLLGAPTTSAPPESCGPLPWQDAWSLARLCERRPDEPAAGRAAAAAWIVAALPGAAEADAPPRFYADAVRILKRVRDWERVAALLAECARQHGPQPWTHLEAAILYEHRLGDLRRALAHARALGDAHRAARLRARIGE
ncbi:MAG: ribonuclease H-like domain-containing protein [bacterium]|nr:ribonuclease H-like domain-containing protein [bacterium]